MVAHVSFAASAQNQLHQLRQARRENSREIQSTKSEGEAAPFGLLVIPVDFSDTRLPDNWVPESALAGSLFGLEGETLRNYFSVASNSRMDLQITLAPLVHLSGDRSSYSDIGWHGFTRTRAMATETIEAVADLGLEFRRLDLSAPHGYVDGVLILHSGAGQENDPLNGKIQPLQFFIDPPVISGEIGASFYAVASLSSGLGVWAHETAHLLGMEDRYDPLLHPEAGGVDVRSLGGLGRFSLMASGAWGTSDGHHPALPDAYSCWQLGWTEPLRYPQAENPLCSVGPWRSGQFPPVMTWSAGTVESEFFLMETRDPESTFPFDAGLPQGQMLVYHVDESVPEGSISNNRDPDYHLRVRLVEADDDRKLQTGDDDGRDEDTFPGPLNNTRLTPTTAPGTDGYQGVSYLSMESISYDGSSVSFSIADTESPYSISLALDVLSAELTLLDIRVKSLGNAFSNLNCTMTVSGGGTFADGENTHQFALSAASGLWIPGHLIAFYPPEFPTDGQASIFEFQFTADGTDLDLETRPWVWMSDNGVFDFNDPDWIFWQQDFPNEVTNTRWHLWNSSPYLTDDNSAVLACTGELFSDSSSWPAVQYGRRGRAALISPAMGQDIKAIQIIHAVEVEYLHPGTVMDGATMFWQGPDGSVVEAEPVDHWDADISAQSDNSLGGIGALADSNLVLDWENNPQWRCDVLALPETGQGPWRLRLEFSSNYLWRKKGWFVAEMRPLSELPDSAFPIQWVTDDNQCGAGLLWQPPIPRTDYSGHSVEFFNPDTRMFEAFSQQESVVLPCDDGFFLDRSFILERLHPAGLTHHLLRVISNGPKGTVASRSVVVYADGGAASTGYMEQPFPNPSPGGLKFLVDIPAATEACLKIFDLRGRLVYSRGCMSGKYQIFWDGRDGGGRPLASGNYYLKLEGSGFSSMRKVVLIR